MKPADRKWCENMILKILLIIMLVLPLAYLAFTLFVNLMDEVISIGKRQEKKAEENDDRRYRGPQRR